MHRVVAHRAAQMGAIVRQAMRDAEISARTKKTGNDVIFRAI